MTEEQRQAFDTAIGDLEGAWFAVEQLRGIAHTTKAPLTQRDLSYLRALSGRLTNDVTELTNMRDLAAKRGEGELH